MFKHRILIQHHEEKRSNNDRVLLFLFNRQEMNKIKMSASGRSRASAQR